MTPAALATALEATRGRQEVLIRAALKLVLAERAFGEARGVPRWEDAENELRPAPRNLVNAIDDLPQRHQPKTWQLPR